MVGLSFPIWTCSISDHACLGTNLFAYIYVNMHLSGVWLLLSVMLHDGSLQRIWKWHQICHHLRLLLMSSIRCKLWEFCSLRSMPKKISLWESSWMERNTSAFVCLEHLGMQQVLVLQLLFTVFGRFVKDLGTALTCAMDHLPWFQKLSIEMSLEGLLGQRTVC